MKTVILKLIPGLMLAGLYLYCIGRLYWYLGQAVAAAVGG